jgi:hypothetical protein
MGCDGRVSEVAILPSREIARRNSFDECCTISLEDSPMNVILILLVLLLLLGGGGGYYYGGPAVGGGIGGLVLIILVVWLLLGNRRV